MSAPRRRPLGFLSGDVEDHCHCMYIYTKKDNTFVCNVVDFLVAGLQTGEVAVSVLEPAMRDEVARRIAQRRARTGLRYADEQLVLCIPSDVYLRNGMLDPDGLVRHWQTVVEPVSRVHGARVFSDTSLMFSSRLSRLKLLEYEAMINFANPMTVSLCGYESGATGRSMLAQARNVHSYIANHRSIRRNATCMSATRFLSGFYRFRRISKEYPSLVRELHTVHRDLTDVAGRTPLTMSEIEDVRSAVGGMFSYMVERAGPSSTSHIHIAFTSESDKLLVVLRDHSLGIAPAEPDLRERILNSEYLRLGLVDSMGADQWRGDLVIHLIKRYKPPISIGYTDR